MADILHLIDDNGVGGVTRVLADHIPRLGAGFTHRVVQVTPRGRLPGRLAADIVVVHFTLSWAKLPYLLALRARLGGAKLVLVEHSYTGAYECRCVRRVGRFRTMLRIAYRLADRVVAVSRGQAAWMTEARLVAPHRLVTIPQASDTAALDLLAPVARTAGPLRLGAYGRYAPQKGFDLLIAAMRLVPPTVATLELAGYGPDAAALQAQAADLPHVTVGGQIAGPTAFLARVDAVVVPSRWEAFGLVAAEARAAGRPVLAAAVDGLVEQIEPAWGAVWTGEDPATVAQAIICLARSDIAAMGQSARGSVASALTATVSRWADLLRSLEPQAGMEVAVPVA